VQTGTRVVSLVIVAALLGPLIAIAPAPSSRTLAAGVPGLPTGAVAPRSAAAMTAFASRPKVVVVVGPTHGLTSSNLAAGEAIAALAEAHGADVRRVFHPNATWANVAAEAQGANVLVYLGHGNGFPSPYTSAPMPDRQNGMGLNPIAGGSSADVKYYGEGFIASGIRLAPRALVLLNHLCYASGNSEPGRTPPSRSVAIQRVDNFAAGFLAAGAGAVIALGHQDAGDMLDGLWTAPGTLDQLFMSRGGIGTGEIRTDSVRTPGVRLHLDPDSATDYYRSIAGSLDIATSDVLGGAVTPGTPGPTPMPGTPAPTPTPTPGIPSPTPVPTAAPTPAPTQPPAGGDATGGPRLSPPDPVVGAFSPNGDGVQDQYSVTARIDRVASWTFRVERDDGQTVMAWTGAGDAATVTWDGRTAAGIAADGAYRVVVEATDGAGAAASPARGAVVVDTVPPVLTSFAAGKVKPTSVAVFTPNGDGASDTIGLSFAVSEASALDIVVRDPFGTPVRAFSSAAAPTAGTGTTTWDGRGDGGVVVPDGTYSVTATPRDLAGNRGVPMAIRVRVLTALRGVATTPLVFDPRDGDLLGATTTLSFSLSQPASVTWRIADASDRTVRILAQSQALPAGPYGFAWDGTGSPGGTGAPAPLPEGRYLNTVTATTGQGAVTIRSTIYLTAFRIIPSASSRSRGQSITVTLVSAEPLVTPPTLTVTQPGLAPYVVATRLVATDTYRATFTIRRAGQAGPMLLVVTGTDTAGGTQSATASVTVR
jgi:flagellar hook assembly protein FlgD